MESIQLFQHIHFYTVQCDSMELIVLFANDTEAERMRYGYWFAFCLEMQWSKQLKANCLIQYSFRIKFCWFILFHLLVFCLILDTRREINKCRRAMHLHEHVSSDERIICTISTYLMNELIVCMRAINFKCQHSLILWFDWNPFELATPI